MAHARVMAHITLQMAMCMRESFNTTIARVEVR